MNDQDTYRLDPRDPAHPDYERRRRADQADERRANWDWNQEDDYDIGGES